MALTQQDAFYWSGIDTATIEECGFLLYGIEPRSFKHEEACSYNAHLGFYEMDAAADIAHLSEIVERAALAGSIEIAHRVPDENGIFDWVKTHLKKLSFLNWCRSNPKYANTAVALEFTPYQNVSLELIAKSEEIANELAINGKREPYLRQGQNDRKLIEEWVAWQARILAANYDNKRELADCIRQIADKNEYRSQRSKLTNGNILKMIPAGLTGGRAKNKGRSRNSPSMTFGKGKSNT